MDIFSIIIVCMAVYGLAKRAPGLIGEAVAEFQAARAGETSQAAQDRRRRLVDAGVDPATGGAFRQFLGNTWRDFWQDMDQKRQNRRMQVPADTEPWRTGPRWSDGIRRRIDDAVQRQADKWRARDADTDPRQPGHTPGAEGPGRPRAASPGPHPQQQNPGPEPEANRQPPPTDPSRPPIRVDATLGEPAAQPTGTATAVLDRPAPQQQIERNPMGSAVATNGTAVTGVVSGAAEARSIQRALEAATQEYEAAVAAARRRIHSLGEQTLSIVQMAGRSTVVNAAAQAAEAIAAAQAGVNACKAEVIPLMGTVAREFDKRNS